MKTGVSKIDGIKAAEGKFSFMNPTPQLEVKSAFVDNTSGHTHGWTTGTTWSPETYRLLDELRVSMEDDLMRLHFREGETIENDTTGSTVGSPAPRGGGLRAHLGMEGEDAPPIPKPGS